MAWGILVTAFTLFGMLALTVASLLLDDATAGQEPDRLMDPASGSSAARPPSVAEPAAQTPVSRKAA